MQGMVVTWYWLCAKYGGNLTGLAATAKDRICFLDQISPKCVQGGLAAFWAAQSEFNNQDIDLGWPSSQKAEVRKMDWLHFRRSQQIWRLVVNADRLEPKTWEVGSRNQRNPWVSYRPQSGESRLSHNIQDLVFFPLTLAPALSTLPPTN